MAVTRTFSEEDGGLSSSIITTTTRKNSDINLLFKSKKLTSSSSEAPGDIFKVTDAAAVKQSVKNIVMTNFGEKPFNFEFGGNIVEYLFENTDEFTQFDVKSSIKESLEIYESRAEVLDIFVNIIPESNFMTATIKFRVVNTDEVVTLETTIARLR